MPGRKVRTKSRPSVTHGMALATLLKGEYKEAYATIPMPILTPAATK